MQLKLIQLLLAVCLVLPQISQAATIFIGVLSHRGDESTLKNWSPTADYLTQIIDEHEFKIVPLDFTEIDPAVKNGAIDFLLVNPSIYVSMEVRYRISRIATLNNLMGVAPYNTFGGVIFTRNERIDIAELEDIVGKSLMAVDEISLGGFQMAWRELAGLGIDPYHDLSSLSFGGTHDDVVNAVRGRHVDVGTVRTGILESMAAAGEINLRDFKVLNQYIGPEHPFSHSTRLYPEWPFSKLHHTPNVLAQRVAIALLRMSELDAAAQWGDYAGWTIPLEYQPVHELLQELNLPPYSEPGRFTLVDAIRKYWYWLTIGLAFILTLALMTTWVSRLNRELKKSKLRLEQQHSLILDSVADGIYGVDLYGNSTFANRAMEEITGWKAEELIGFNQHEILHHTRKDGSPHPGTECPVYLTFQDNRTRFIEDDLFWKKDGSSFPVEYSSTPIRDENGVTIGSVVVFRDISDRKQAQEEARQYQMDLAHVARLSTMGEMASGIAHEINQPLTAIATNADASIRLLESGFQHEDRLIDIMERISSQARRAGGIIQQLRQFVRKEQPELSLVDLNELIEEVLILIRPEIQKAEVRLVKDLADELPRVLAQHIQIDQVILNLARNAIEAMSEIPRQARVLTIRTRPAGKNAVITTVEDTGPGPSEQVREKLFDPFVTSKANGMGLGLSISYGIIESHKGKLYLDSKPAAGAVFRFTLPINQEQEPDV